MPSEDLKDARRLIQERWSSARPREDTHKTLEPAIFREIDGRELARQYVAHRSLMETESRVRLPGGHAHEDPARQPDEAQEQYIQSPSVLHRRFLGWVLGFWRT